MAHLDDGRGGLWGPGTVLGGGRYRLVQMIGRGAMGEVWVADRQDGARIALKLVDLASRGDPNVTRARFQREANAAAQLKSPHVVHILDHGIEGRVAFIAMELLEGENLEERLARKGRLPPAEVAEILRQIARALDKAHAAGIVHRDIKPSNVFVVKAKDGALSIKVVDFGLAKLVAQQNKTDVQTQSGVLVGTPVYMSPEQLLGDPVDHRSDLWQMGILAYECLVGERPFDERALGGLCVHICSEPMPVPSTKASVPPAFDAWFARATKKHRKERFESAGELAVALSDAIRPSSASRSFEVPTGLAYSLVPPPARASKPNLTFASPRPRVAAFPLIAAPLALIALGAALLVADFGSDRATLTSPLEATTPVAAACEAVVQISRAKAPEPSAAKPVALPIAPPTKPAALSTRMAAPSAIAPRHLRVRGF